MAEGTPVAEGCGNGTPWCLCPACHARRARRLGYEVVPVEVDLQPDPEVGPRMRLTVHKSNKEVRALLSGLRKETA